MLKRHPSVADAAVVGVPDERFGQAITALVEAHAGDTVDEAALIAHVKEQIAALQGAQARAADRHRRPGRERQARLQAPHRERTRAPRPRLT